MRLTLAAVPDSSRDVGGTINVAAYEAYLLGRYHWNLRTTAGMIEATAAFKRAIAADSNYARAWSGLADSYALSVPGEYSVPGVTADSILPLAEAAARRAIALAPTLGEAYASLGETLENRQRNAEILAAFERAISLSPAYATGHQWYSYALMANRRFEDGVREMEVAHRLDPLWHVITPSLAIGYDDFHGVRVLETTTVTRVAASSHRPPAVLGAKRHRRRSGDNCLCEWGFYRRIDREGVRSRSERRAVAGPAGAGEWRRKLRNPVRPAYWCERSESDRARVLTGERRE